MRWLCAPYIDHIVSRRRMKFKTPASRRCSVRMGKSFISLPCVCGRNTGESLLPLRVHNSVQRLRVADVFTGSIHARFVQRELSVNIPNQQRQDPAGLLCINRSEGVDHTNKDLRKNFEALASFDLCASHGLSHDPMPVRDEENSHGTHCAGEVAMEANNSYCGVGIAFNARIGGIRLLAGNVTDAMEATALTYNMHFIDIYVCSWGPPTLTWRDVQHLIALTAKIPDPKEPGWTINAAGYHVHHRFGFGVLDAGLMVQQAVLLRTAAPQRKCKQEETFYSDRFIPAGGQVSINIESDGCQGRANEINTLEHVQVRVRITAACRGDLSISLESPGGTVSLLLDTRPYDASTAGLKNWTMMTVHCWGEQARGLWTLKVREGLLPSFLLMYMFDTNISFLVSFLCAVCLLTSDGKQTSNITFITTFCHSKHCHILFFLSELCYKHIILLALTITKTFI
ncbi:proprotein convertase subtilisin/kexin type 5-like [Fundulus heteroclitus]|uniref:proprotein convertase subtilisin/kexin type 5-like n=1 Tax=Fundulus heteroclitus TaxID=8078 RepID=UPI00165B2638|nr:proprotein convertase subtilisin/kexin type 5-like [Fundulus heteroclitus]